MKRIIYLFGLMLIVGSLFFVTPAVAQNDNANRTEQTADDDDDDSGKWGLAGLLGLLGLLGLKRRDDDDDRKRASINR
jgi:MYXO-CTERM domain-containing protein